MIVLDTNVISEPTRTTRAGAVLHWLDAQPRAPDAQIAAIAHAHGAMLATRNIKHFTGRWIRLINPWTGEVR